MRSRSLFTQKSTKQKEMSYDNKFASRMIIDQNQFSYEYSQFTMGLPFCQQLKSNVKYLFELYLEVCSFGGLINAISTNKIDKIRQNLGIKFGEGISFSTQNVVQHYIRSHLFSFQIAIQTGKKIQNDKLINLLLPKFIQSKKLLQHLQNHNKGIKLFNEDIVVLENICFILGFDDEIFNVKKLSERYGDSFVYGIVQFTDYDVQIDAYQEGMKNKNLSQKSDSSQLMENFKSNSINGFRKFQKFVSGITDIQSFRSTEQIQITLNEYAEYFRSDPNKMQKYPFKQPKYGVYSKIAKYGGQQIIFGYKFDSKDDYYINYIYQRVCGTSISYKQHFDLLSYADQDISGVTLPIFAMHVKGCWLGGRQQLYGMSKVDINFGPHSTQWYCIASENISKFSNIFKSQYGIGIDKIEGEWFENLEWFIQRKIPIKKLVQYHGDAVLVGSGSLYWHKSKDKSLHCYWNIIPKTDKQIVVMINKSFSQKQNSQKFVKVPIKSILLRALNHEELTKQTKNKEINENSRNLSFSSIAVIRQYLKKLYIEEEKYLNQMIVKQDLQDIKFKLYHLFDAESFCSLCQNQIFTYFTNNNGLYCLSCTSKCFQTKKITQLKDKTVYCKNDIFWVYQLISYGNIRNVGQENTNNCFPQFQQLCYGDFISQIGNCNFERFDKNQKYQTISTQKEWRKEKQNFINQLRQESHQHRYKQELQCTILKNLKKQNQQSLYQSTKHEQVQTKLCLLNSGSDNSIIRDLVPKDSQGRTSNYRYDRNSYYPYSRHKKYDSNSQSQKQKRQKKRCESSTSNEYDTTQMEYYEQESYTNKVKKYIDKDWRNDFYQGEKRIKRESSQKSNSQWRERREHNNDHYGEKDDYHKKEMGYYPNQRHHGNKSYQYQEKKRWENR